MKIEKLNDNQIRCTLTREDLATRHLNLIELAYGSEKARSLFREMMQQASSEFGFEVNDIPIMVEAIPMSMDSLILIITKVEDPDELDTRFSKFTPDTSTQGDASDFLSSLKMEGADDVLNLFRKIKEAHRNLSARTAEGADRAADTEDAPVIDMTRLYRFSSLDDVICAAHVLGGSYQGENSLYRHPQTNEYDLILSSAGNTPEEFNKICNTISEYGEAARYSSGIGAFLAEHGTKIIPAKALQQLSGI